MLNILKERQRRHSLSSKEKHRHGLQQINLNMFQPYLPEKRSKHNNLGSRANGKENNKNRKSQQFKDLGMPGVKFKNNDLQCEEKHKEAKIKQKQSFKHLQADTFGQNKDKMNITFQVQPKQHTSNHKKQTQQKSQSSTKVRNGQYLQRYQAAIAKIFKSLDIFNRGTITQTNINKWIPEEALYFLGKVFQKIRQERLYLSNRQFLKHCLPILYESSQEDVKVFLQEVNGKDIAHTVSIDFPSEEKNSESPVQYKITKDSNFDLQNNKSTPLYEYQRSNYKPLVPCEDLIGSIKQKQKMLNQRLNSIKQKQTNLQQRNFTSQRSKKNESLNQTSTSKEKYIKNQNSNNLKVSNFQSPKRYLSNANNKQEKNGNDFIRNQFNFSFQLPEFKNYLTGTSNFTGNTNRNQKLILKNEVKLQNTGLNLQKVQNNPIPLRTSRIVRQNIRPKETLSHQKMPPGKEEDTQRIDRLSSRLQEYIKFNKEKIQKNRRFIRQNSAPKA